MSAEKPHFSEIETELHFGIWIKENNIKQFLFDFDDTICNTSKLFREQMSLAYDFLAINNPQISRDQWQKEIEAGNNKFFEQLGVCPDRWDHVVDELIQKHPMPLEIQLKTKAIFQQTYNTPLEMLDGAQKGLEFLTKVGIPIGIVTHANREWTFKKYNWLNLNRFLNWDDVYIVDENGHKTHESWQEAIKYFKLNPENCVVVGDSPRSDINPAQKAGVKHCFLIENPYPWSIHQQPMDSSTKLIKNLSQIIEIGTEKL